MDIIQEFLLIEDSHLLGREDASQRLKTACGLIAINGLEVRLNIEEISGLPTRVLVGGKKEEERSIKETVYGIMETLELPYSSGNFYTTP